MERLKREEGFTLILVMVAVVIITLVGTTVVYTSGADHLAARGRQHGALARQVAEAGLNHYALLVQPTLIPSQISTVTGAGGSGGGGSGGGAFTYDDILEGVTPYHEQDLPSAPHGFTASYAVWGGSVIDDGIQIILEGRLAPVDEPNRIVARSRISTVIVMTSGSDGYSGTVGWTPRNTGVLGGGSGEGYAGW